MQQLATDEAGHVWEVDDQGNPLRLHQAAGAAPVGNVFSLPPTAAQQQQIAASQVSTARTQQQMAREAALAPVQQATAQAQLDNIRNPRSAPPSGYRYKADGNLEVIPGGPAVAANGVKKGNGSLDAIVSQINDYTRRFGETAGATSGLAGVADYLPGQNRAALDASGDLLEEIATSAFKVPGMGGQSDADAARLARAYKPSRYNLDSATETTLDGLRRRVDTARSAAGLPAAVWNSPDARAIATGATRTERDPKIEAVVNAMIRRGASEDDINAAISPLGGGTVAPGSVARAQEFLRKNPTYKGGFAEATKESENTARQRISGSAMGAFLGNAFNDAFAGIPAAAVGNQDALAAQQATYPGASMAGSIVGGIAGAAGLEAGLGAGAARLGSGLLSRAVANPITADALYGGVQGGTSGGDLTSAAIGAGAGVTGGMFGRGAGRAIGAGVRGVTSAPVRYLQDRGVPLTVGQVVGNGGVVGRTVKGIEDRLTGIPLVGEVVNARRLDGFRGFNRAAFNEGVQPIPGTVNRIGEEGVEDAQALVGAHYDRTLDPVRLQADPTYVARTRGTLAAGAALPEPMAGRANYSLNTRVGNSFDANGGLTGRNFQQSIRGLRGDASSVANEPFGHDFGSVTRRAEGDLEDLLDRQSPGTLPEYRNANTAFRNTEVVRDAVNRGRNGTRVGEAGLFAPSQLADAASANARRFGNAQGTTNQPFFELARAGQQVLPSRIADSGTAGRLAVQGLLGAGGLGALGAGSGYAAGDADTGLAVGGTGAAVLGALALGGTRTGQHVLTSALLNRPAIARRVGQAVINYDRIPGMFGAGSLPVLLSQ